MLCTLCMLCTDRSHAVRSAPHRQCMPGPSPSRSVAQETRLSGYARCHACMLPVIALPPCMRPLLGEQVASGSVIV